MAKDNILDSPIFKAFADASESVYIYVTDMATGVSRWSASAIKFFDLPGEYMDDPVKIWSEKIHPNDIRTFLDDIEAVFSGQIDKHCCQYRALNRYGEYVWLECRGTMIYDEDNNMSTFAGMMTRLDCQSMYDPITGLLSKSEYYNYDFSKNNGVVMILGVDHFRRVNVTYGYNYGEDVLAELGKILSESCDIYKKIYRFNGDEFVMVIPEIDKKIAEDIFNSITERTKKVEMKDGRYLSVSFTAGGLEYSAFDGSKDDILNYLEITLDYAKHTNRGGISFFDNVIKEKQNRINEIKKEIKASIGNNFEGFELYYQPWIDARGIKIVGCEALLRWKGETIKDSGPGEFIPIMEETNDIIEVGYFVMKEAMRQQKEWQEKYGDFKVSFNVSYKQFLVNGFADELIKTARELDIKTSNIIIELTESCDVETTDTLAETFREIRSYGFEIALDDFGTGYSSMELLKKLPANDIKIEHNFVRELEKTGHDVDFAIIEAILLLCKRVNCEVVVEGVENEEVDEIVRRMDVNYLQGYYYSKPISKKDFEYLVEENRRKI